jgi:hypothetical protein
MIQTNDDGSNLPLNHDDFQWSASAFIFSLSLFGLHLPWLPERERERKRALADPGSVGSFGDGSINSGTSITFPGVVHPHPPMHACAARARAKAWFGRQLLAVRDGGETQAGGQDDTVAETRSVRR